MFSTVVKHHLIIIAFCLFEKIIRGNDEREITYEFVCLFVLEAPCFECRMQKKKIASVHVLKAS